ncbi:MAG: M14 family metallopeptidase [Bacteroidota bacterium]|nr:M14 family metallopeptidase [Bacteroidota bacterium]
MFKIALSFAFILIFFQAFSQPLTIAESSKFESTSTEKDVNDFIQKITKHSSIVRVETMAVSIESRAIPLLIIADPMIKSPVKLSTDKRVVLYIQANIHAGEVEGKEASLMFARDLISGMKKEILKNVIVLICPNFNPDGNEAISTKNRTYQNGPKNGVGLRYNGQMLDINRDAMKLETPEMSGLLKNVLLKWDPQITVDCHTTNGSYHEEPVTFTWMMNPAGDRSLTDFMEKQMMPEVSGKLRNEYKTDNCFYGEFIDMKTPEKGWEYSAAEPRYLSNYIGVRNRLAILNENYVYADYKSRVLGCYGLLHSIADYAVNHAVEIKELIRTADQKTIDRGLNPEPTDSFPISYTGKPINEKVTIKTFEVDVVSDSQGRETYKKSDRKKTVQVPYTARYEATKSVKFPFAYLFNVSDPLVINLLRKHGIQVSQLSKGQTFDVETFKLTELKSAPKLNQGHFNQTASGVWISEHLEFKAGTFVIRTAQPLANVASYLLEPQSNDGLLKWNFMDRYLVPQWGRGFNPYPVYKIQNRTIIEDTVLPSL